MMQNGVNMGFTSRCFLVITTSLLFVLCTCTDLTAQTAAGNGKVGKVVIDAGHGGKDPGCVYKTYYEKNVTLALAKKLGELITANYPDVDVVYTRSTDVYVELAERGKIANRVNADLFISIHINSATNSSARGTSTHVMGMDKSGKKLEVAMRENDVIIYEEDYTTKYEGYNPGDPASYIMFSLMQYAYQNQSMMLAETIQKHFRNDLPMPDRGTTQEPFLVLWRAAMPSVLVEVGFMSNQTDRSYITSSKGQNEIARSLFDAFSEYKNAVEGRTSVIELREPESEQPVQEEKKTEEKKKRRKDKQDEQSTRLVGQEPYDGVLFYVQIGFLGKSRPLDDPGFGSYRNRVVEKREAGRGYRYLVGGVRDYGEIVDMQAKVRKEFPDAFVVAYDGDERIDVETARRRAEQ